MRKKRMYGASKATLLAYTLPCTIFYTLLVILPIFVALYYSLYKMSGPVQKTYIGLGNYVELLHDDLFWKSFKNNLFLCAVCFFGQLTLAFIGASLLNKRYIRHKNFHRTIQFFPSTVSAAVVGFVWSLVFDYNYGLINRLFKAIGLAKLVQPWLSVKSGIMWVVSIPILWQYVGYYMIILLAAFSALDKDIFDMAEIDGASGWQLATKITLPLLKKSIIVCMILCISGSMKVFDHIYSMTNGGPGNSSMVMAMYAYKTSILNSRIGYGMAMSIGILILSLTVIVLTRSILQRIGGKDDY